jgi:hypothetical protein
VDAVTAVITLVLLELLIGRRLRQLLGGFLLVMVLLLLVSLVGPLTRAIPRQSGGPTMFAADSNVFMDLWPACRARLDQYLDNPAVTLYVHVHVYSEALGANDRRGTQAPRLSRLQRPGALRVPDAAPPPADAAAMLSTNFGPVDMAVIETARVRGVPLLSTNAAGLRRQVRSDTARAARYGGVQVIDPCAGMKRPG